MADSIITLNLSPDEALVLFDWLSRFNEKRDQSFDHPAEQRVLWDLEAMLESQLVAPFAPNYAALVASARENVGQ